MKFRPLWILPIAVVAMSAIGIYRGYANRQEQPWRHDLGKALAEAKAKNKLVLVDFNATWCGPCKMYRDSVFPNADFQNRAKDLILVDIDIDQQQALAMNYKVHGIPDIRVISPSGAELGKVVGFEEQELYSAIDLAQALK